MALELAEIFRRYGSAYRQKHASQLLPSQRTAMRAIEHCRTEVLGGKVYRCAVCGETDYSYHSCRNRHCPKCQQEQTEEWLTLQQELLLPTPYFLLTFTLPSELRDLAFHHQKLIYDLLFHASSQAVQKLAKDPRLIGGQIGLVGVLQTWTRDLIYHPHVHYLAPAGGLASDGQTLRLGSGQAWLKARHNFLPAKALSPIFRAIFRRALQKTNLFAQVSPKVWRKKWVVHCKPVGNGQAALKYLAPYIFRVALSNRRLIRCVDTGDMASSRITFSYRSSDDGQLKRCTLSAEDFIQRFLQHILPHRFVKVRYYGFFAPTQRTKLRALQQHLASPIPLDEACQEIVLPVPHKFLCPKCGQPMLFQYDLPPVACRSP